MKLLHSVPMQAMSWLVAVLAFGCLVTNSKAGSQWPQFRGPNGSAVSETEKPPIEFGPDKNLLWKLKLPAGHSSPVIWDNHIFLTGFDEGKLVTICVSRKDGNILWKQTAPAAEIEKVHAVSNPAAPTPVTDGMRVYVYFGSYGVLAYDFEGTLAWQAPIPRPSSTWGTAASPILVGDSLIQVSDSNKGGSALIAFNAADGTERWRTARHQIGSGWCTPFLWNQGNVKEIVVGSSSRLISYEPAKGTELWRVSGLFRDAVAMPAGNDDFLFYVTPGLGSSDTKIDAWAEMLTKFDTNKDGKVEKTEIPKGAGFVMRSEVPAETPGNIFQYAWVIGMADRNQDGAIEEAEWAGLLEALKAQPSSLFAVKPGGKGEVGNDGIAWRQSKGLPEIPSPLLYRDRVYLLRDGGMLTCCVAKTGEVVYDRERIGTAGQYCASPIAANSRIYAASERGMITVLKAGDKFEVEKKVDLGEKIYATPALADHKLYVRTASHLWAFGE